MGCFLWSHRAKNPFKTLKGSSSRAKMKSLTFWRGRERSVLLFLGKTAPPLSSCHLLPGRHWMMHLSLRMKSSHGREWERGLFVTSAGDGGFWRPSYGAGYDRTSVAFVNENYDEISSSTNLYHVTKTRRDVNAGHVTMTIIKCIMQYRWRIKTRLNVVYKIKTMLKCLFIFVDQNETKRNVITLFRLV